MSVYNDVEVSNDLYNNRMDLIKPGCETMVRLTQLMIWVHELRDC